MLVPATAAKRQLDSSISGGGDRPPPSILYLAPTVPIHPAYLVDVSVYLASYYEHPAARINDTAPNWRSLRKPEFFGGSLRQTPSNWLSGTQHSGPSSDLNILRRQKLLQPNHPKEFSVPPHSGDIGTFARQRTTRPHDTSSRPVGQVVRQIEELATGEMLGLHAVLEPENLWDLHL